MKKLLLAFVFAASGLTASAQMANQATPVAAAKSQAVVKPQAAVKTQKAASTIPAAQRAIPYTKELQTKLGLNADQYSKILAVNTECITRKDALKGAEQKKAGGSKEIAQYRQEQYKTILTPDQLSKLKTLNAQGGAKPKA